MEESTQRPAAQDAISESSPLLKTRYTLTRRRAKGFGQRRITSTPPKRREYARKLGAR